MTISPHRLRRSDSPIRRRDSSRGGAAVEFALVLPIFLLLVMGALDYGYFFFSDQVVAAAVREGARAGTMDTFANAPTTALNVAYAYMQANGVGCGSLGGSTCIHTSAVNVMMNGLSINKVVVDIHYPFTSLTGYSSVVIPANVKGYAEMRW
jgi:Flp pilus assembly protein TadG